MRGFFSVEGKFFTVTGKIADMVLITILWLIGCIPVVTILTSSASMQTFVNALRHPGEDQLMYSAELSLQGHIMAFAAEESRAAGGRVIELP